MTTPRRSVLAAIVAAPVVGSGVAHSRPAPIDLDSLDVLELLERGASNPDAKFSRLCSVALDARARSELAYRLYADAEKAVLAATPEFPPALISHGVYRKRDGSTMPVEDRWTPERPMSLWDLAHGEAKRRGVEYSPALEAELRKQYDDWSQARASAKAAYRVAELDQAQCAADRVAMRALDAVQDYPARSADVLMLKLYLRLADDDVPADSEIFSALVADVARVLRT